jgi:hypothetical protein
MIQRICDEPDENFCYKSQLGPWLVKSPVVCEGNLSSLDLEDASPRGLSGGFGWLLGALYWF